MPTLAWILVSGLAMAAIALVGGITTVLPEPTLDKIVLPLVALAAGSLLGGAFFHMLPEAVREMGNELDLWIWLTAGFVGFFVLEQYLRWHHCHRVPSRHRPLGYLILVADGTHNLIGGLAVGSAFIVDHRVGLIAWIAAAAHEVPQELGDFGILLNSGWGRRRALLYNLVSALTFLLGSVIAYAVSGALDVAPLIPFAAGNFVYIAAADLLPEISTRQEAGAKVIYTGAFATGLVVLLAATAIT